MISGLMQVIVISGDRTKQKSPAPPEGLEPVSWKKKWMSRRFNLYATLTGVK